MQNASQEMSNAENFKNAFKPYLIKWSIVYAVLVAFITFITVCISMRNWYFSQLLISWLLDMGATFDGRNIHYSVITIGTITIGIVPVVINGAGVFAFGVNVAGVFAFGVNAVGVVAIGTNAIGIITIGVNAVGIVAIGHGACGYYTLTYSERCKGRYKFAPHQQDVEAVDFFSRWFPKLSDTVSNQ